MGGKKMGMFKNSKQAEEVASKAQPKPIYRPNAGDAKKALEIYNKLRALDEEIAKITDRGPISISFSPGEDNLAWPVTIVINATDRDYELWYERFKSGIYKQREDIANQLRDLGFFV